MRDVDAGWHDFAPAIQRRVLWQREGEASMLYCLQAGVQVAHHGHGHDEECLMLQGDLFLDDVLLQQGDYQLAPTGTDHRLTETDTGGVLFDGRPLFELSAVERSAVRNQSVGFIFQFYHLLPEFDVMGNVLLSAAVRFGWFSFRRQKAELRTRAETIIDSLGLRHRMHHRPNQLSGGERQRVAIARALMNAPRVLLADEPTGNLDIETGLQIMSVLENLHRNGQTVVMVTHDRTIAKRADRVVVMKDGQLE